MTTRLTHHPAVHIRTLRTSGEAEFDALARIYTTSILESERKSMAALRRMVERPEYLFLMALAGSSIVGFTISIRLADSGAALLEYMAVDPAHRGRGIGQALFQHTAAHEHMADRFLLVEVDAAFPDSPDLQECVRRKAFYRRLGCKELAGLSYRMPTVSSAEPPVMDMLVFHRDLPGFIEKARVRSWLGACYREVYGKPCDDPAIDQMLSGVGDKIALN